MTFTPTRRYSAVAVFSEDLERIVLIHKLRPAWQAGKANFPSGKVEDKDDQFEPCDKDYWFKIHRRCAVRELAEETDLVVAASSLKLFCTLRFRDADSGDDSECQFFCCVGDVEAARTMETERVFVDASASIQQGYEATYDTFRNSKGRVELKTSPTQTAECPYLGDVVNIPTMSNLPWLTAMARQTLRGSGAPPFVVYEAGATL